MAKMRLVVEIDLEVQDREDRVLVFDVRNLMKVCGYAVKNVHDKHGTVGDLSQGKEIGLWRLEKIPSSDETK